MDEGLKILLAILSTIITILLTVIANGVKVIYDKQKTFEATVSNMKLQVDELIAWKNRVQDDEMKEKDKLIEHLKLQLRNKNEV